MPFDCSPTIESPKRSHVDASNAPDLGIDQRSDPFNVRPIPAWHATRRPESIGTSLAVLGLARQLITDERRWCQGAFACSWLSIPVPADWVLARRFCALGANRDRSSVTRALTGASTPEVPGCSLHGPKGHQKNHRRCQGQNRVHERLPSFLLYRLWVEQHGRSWEPSFARRLETGLIWVKLLKVVLSWMPGRLPDTSA